MYDERKKDDKFEFINASQTLKKKNKEYIDRVQKEMREKEEIKKLEKEKGADKLNNDNNKAETEEKVTDNLELDDETFNLVNKLEDKIDKLKYELSLKTSNLSMRCDKIGEFLNDNINTLHSQIVHSEKITEKNKQDNDFEFKKLYSEMEETI